MITGQTSTASRGILPRREAQRPVLALMGHLRRAGAVVAPIDVHYPSGGFRGIRAASAIRSGAPILSIPLSSLLTTDVARASTIGRAITDSGAALDSTHSLIAAFLLQERLDPRSSFWPYLDSLPISFATFPLFFGEDDLALLEGSMTVAKIEARRASIQHDDDALRAAVPMFRRFSSASFLRARITVTSRIFGLTIAGQKTEALVPLADMLNHREPPETHWTYDDEAGAFVMTALRSFAVGEPIHDSYGRKCNSRFFLSYGFALEDNEDNEAIVRLGPSARAFQISTRPDDDRAREALSFLRTACATESELSAALGTETLPLNARNESAALRALAAACESALAAFPTTLDEDDTLLAEGRLSPRARLCIIQRRGEKRVLRAWIDLVVEALPFLRLPWERLVQTTRERSGNRHVDRHLHSIVSALTERRRAERAAIREGVSR
ncbi:Hypothetical protein A7982_11317 [Minicystis rosea]|nr:Hypothetical protein A7982_11317 [Minicystis rosea]